MANAIGTDVAPDVFISYAREDRASAEALATNFSSHGWRVWWDPKIPFGKSYDEVIERALDSAKCVIVLWSQHAVASRWVRAEAQAGLDRDVLVPVLIEQVRPPLAFRDLQAAQLWDWHGEAKHQELDRLIQHVAGLLPPRSSEMRPPVVLEPLAYGEGAEATHVEPVRVTVHIARFIGTGAPCCFINVTNLAPSDVEVTHVWVDSTPPAFPTTRDRLLPKRLQPQESWETWIPLSELPRGLAIDRLPQMARARLSTGRVVPSVANDSVPPQGSVPGGPIRDVP